MTDHFRELDYRSNDRIEVRLLWHQRDDRVIVAVADGKTGERFTVDVRDGESALDVFHHPFAYAAELSRTERTRAGSPRCSRSARTRWRSRSTTACCPTRRP